MNQDFETVLRESRGESTHLGVCPMAKEILIATILEAREHEFTPMFIATPRQVDGDRGYTPWSQQELVEEIELICDSVGYDGPYVLARDHGGPYQSRRDRDDTTVGLDTAMEYATELFAADLEAGFDVLHVDATEDPNESGPLSIEEIAARTTRLINTIEQLCNQIGRAPVYYEVGTEEVTGGMTDPNSYQRFLTCLKQDLSAETFQRILFAVGEVGTTMRIDMRNTFDADQAAALVAEAKKFDVHLKTHFSDWLNQESLERFPNLDIGAANVGPEFSAALIKSLEDLETRERELLEQSTMDRQPSKWMQTLQAAAIRDAPWKKYVPENERDKSLIKFAERNKRSIALCVGRYVMRTPEVHDAQLRLYENITSLSSTDPDAVVVEGVRSAIHRYVEAFNLGGS